MSYLELDCDAFLKGTDDGDNPIECKLLLEIDAEYQIGDASNCVREGWQIYTPTMLDVLRLDGGDPIDLHEYDFFYEGELVETDAQWLINSIEKMLEEGRELSLDEIKYPEI